MCPEPGHQGTIRSRSHHCPVAYFKPNAVLSEVRISGPPIGPKVGPSPLNSTSNYMLHAWWPAQERERFLVFQTRGNYVPPLTPIEKAWLKANYKGEFNFLRCHQLSIYKEEDRSEGRQILRAFMAPDEDNENGGSNSNATPATEPVAFAFGALLLRDSRTGERLPGLI